MHALQTASLQTAAAKAGMSEKTARKYRGANRLPSQMRAPHSWRTRPDPFADVADLVEGLLANEPGLQAKTLFEHLQIAYPGRFADGQLRSLQRRIKTWRATEGPDREVFFDQEHKPGDLAQSDFCHATRLHVTIGRAPFPHLLYHFVLTYSNWEFASVCFSESLESLSDRLQAALRTLGGAPRQHRTDSLTAAVQRIGHASADRDEFTQRYQGLMRHYGIEPQHTQPTSPNENGDVEQSHHRFLVRLDQALMLRGSRDFATRQEYDEFLCSHCRRANLGRQQRFEQEVPMLRQLPCAPYDASKRLLARVCAGSTIRVQGNVYAVPSRLIGERVGVVVHSQTIDVFYGQRLVARMDRLRGRNGASIDYRHVIDWLVRKPGAFDGYVYRNALFPTSRFRMAYDALMLESPERGKKQYLLILQLAAHRGQALVEAALRRLLEEAQPITARAVCSLLDSAAPAASVRDVQIAPVDLGVYDALLPDREITAEVAHV
jgi:transposase